MENENSEICGKQEFLFCGKRDSQNSCFVENENSRILVLWKIRIREFSFCGQRESENFLFAENENPRIVVSWKMRIREFSFRGKRESENSRFVEKRESENSRFVENENPKNSRFVENENARIFVLSKTRILFLWKMRMQEFPICGKRESLSSRFVENEIP